MNLQLGIEIIGLFVMFLTLAGAVIVAIAKNYANQKIRDIEIEKLKQWQRDHEEGSHDNLNRIWDKVNEIGGKVDQLVGAFEQHTKSHNG